MQTIGKYEVHEKLGSGGTAVVYKGYDPYIKRPVAIKICLSSEEETRQRFHREAEVAGRLVHRNITTVYDFGVHRELPYLVEEYLPGEDLAQLIRRREPGGLYEKVHLLRQIADGLAFAHAQGVIHRDIKPSNIRVLEDGSIKIMDFGTAKLAEVESRLTQDGMTLGTIAYLAPERLAGQPGERRSDIFSLGVLAYELLLFQRPFEAKGILAMIDVILKREVPRLADLMPECPARLVETIHTCLEKEPEKRFRSCDELTSALDSVLCELAPEEAEPAPRPQETSGQLPEAIVLQISGLLDRARQLLAESKADRARLLLDEVLELDPANPAALELLVGTWEGGGGSDAPSAGQDGGRGGGCDEGGEQSADDREEDETLEVLTGADRHRNDPESQRQRRITEAVGAVERSIHQGELTAAAETLRFAVDLLGEFPQLPTLRRRLAEVLQSRTMRLRHSATMAARGMGETMRALDGKGSLTLPIAELLREWIKELDPGNPTGRELLAEIKRREQHSDPAKAESRSRRQAEAVASIESLLAEGEVQMARDALAFARDLFGDFEQARGLEERIEHASR